MELNGIDLFRELVAAPQKQAEDDTIRVIQPPAEDWLSITNDFLFDWEVS